MIHNLESQQSIKNGSKSFYLASLFFSEKIKQDSWSLYRWCRTCDDAIDQAPQNQLLERLDFIFSQSKLAFENDPTTFFPEVSSLIQKHHIPQMYFNDMLEGFKSDALKNFPKDEKELLTYSYQVAGVVGLIMSYIMGVNDKKALPHAVDLGIAMQLTNIARDVREDAFQGRVYIPASWLKEKGLTNLNLIEPEHRMAVYEVVEKILSMADRYYNFGRRGLRYLPLRAAWAVCIASYIYQAIGKKIRKQGPWSLDQRVIISPSEKLYWLLFASVKMIPVLVGRIKKPWKRTSLRHVEYIYE